MLAYPPIDILLATYNGAKYVDEQVASIMMQTYGNWRLLISDDCSQDDTVRIIHRLADKDDRIDVVSEGMRYGGACANFMQLMRYSEAPYVMFSDQDDVWLPKKIERTYSYMLELERSYGRSTPLLVFCDLAVVDQNLDLICDSFERYCNLNPARIRLNHLLVQNVAAGCSMMFNRALANACAAIENTQSIVMHDHWIMLIASAFGRIAYIDEPLSLYRQHESNDLGASKFTPLHRVEGDLRIRLTRAQIAQAKSFLAVYGGIMDEADRRCVEEYVAHGETEAYFGKNGGLRHLVRSGCWKHGIRRKLGQIATAFELVWGNRREES